MEAPCNRCYRRSTHMASDPATIFAQTPCVLSLPTDSPCGPLCEMLKPTCPRAGKSRSAWEFTSQWEGWGCINTPTPLPLMGTTLWCNLCTPAPKLPCGIKANLSSMRLSLWYTLLRLLLLLVQLPQYPSRFSWEYLPQKSYSHEPLSQDLPPENTN